MNFTWRRINEEDFNVIDKWDSNDIQKYVTFDGEFLLSEYYEMFGDPDYKTGFVATDNNEMIVGILLYDNESENENIKNFNIQLLVVNPLLTRCGNGTKMLSDILERYKNEFDIFRIHVENDNIACVKMCKKLGLKPNEKKKKKSHCSLYELRVNELNKNRK